MHDQDNQPSIHARIDAVLRELGLTDLRCHRTGILIRNGYCHGRQFCYEGAQVIWRLEPACLEFYAPDGQLLKELPLADPSQPERAAA